MITVDIFAILRARFEKADPEIPAHTPKVALVESKRQRRSKMRSIARRQQRNLKQAVAR